MSKFLEFSKNIYCKHPNFTIFSNNICKYCKIIKNFSYQIQKAV